jgi:DNA polymerase III epsilon subunit-like protein
VTPSAEILISVDIEASGPSPSTGSMIAIGACPVDDPDRGFYRELQPLHGLPWDPVAERVHRLSEDRLREQGIAPARAMEEFRTWIADVSAGERPVFVGFNAPFDWMFVADYFHRFLGTNPFGISALDLKSLYMGSYGVTRWDRTTMRAIAVRIPLEPAHTHQALDDARMQAALARAILRRAARSATTASIPG